MSDRQIEMFLDNFYNTKGATRMAVVKKKKKSTGGRWENVPRDDAELDNGGYELECTKGEATQTKESDDHPERLMYVLDFKVNAPESHAGRTHRERFVIGNDDDPQAEDPDTLAGSPGAKSFKSFCDAAGIQMPDDDEDLMAACEGEKVYALIEKRAGRDGGTFVNVKRGGWLAVGEEEPFIESGDGKKDKKKATSKVAKKVVTKKRASEEEDDDEEEEEEEPAPKKKVATKKVVKKKPAEDEEEEEEEEESDEDSDDDEDEEEDERPRKRRGK